MKAFPTEHAVAGTMDLQADGMDLRDYFAAHIIQGLVANSLTSDNDANVINAAWGLADKMMEARK